MGVNFDTLLKAGPKAVRKTKGKNIKKVASSAHATTQLILKKAKMKLKTPHVICVPKIGGVLPLILIFVLLSVKEPLDGGTATIVREINEVHKKSDTKTSVNIGAGLYLNPGGSRKGSGLFLKPYKKN